MNIEVSRYRKSDGYLTRYWAVTVDGELLAVILYRRGAEAIAGLIASLLPAQETIAPAEETPSLPE